MKKVILLFIFLAVNLFVRAQQMKIGAKMPDFSLKSSVYGNVDSAGLKGKVVLVSLFATWCAPCQLELAEIQKKLWSKYGSNKDFSLIVIGREHTEEQLKVYNDKKKFAFPLYPDPERKVYSMFAENTIPRAYLFNKKGELIYSSTGYSNDEFQVLMRIIEENLSK